MVLFCIKSSTIRKRPMRGHVWLDRKVLLRPEFPALSKNSKMKHRNTTIFYFRIISYILFSTSEQERAAAVQRLFVASVWT